MRRRDARNLEAAAQVLEWAPPGWLPADAAAIWRELTDAAGAEHFAACDAEVLAVFCCQQARLRVLLRTQAALPTKPRSDLQHERAAALAKEIATLSRQQQGLARSLRILPISRREERESDHRLPPTRTPRPTARQRKGADIVALPGGLSEADLLP